MRFFIAASLLATCCAIANAQDFNRYKTLLPQGTVPKDFTERSAEKFAAELTSLDGESRKDRKTKTKFYLESTYGIDDFLTGGNVLFNDEVSQYTSSVLAEILKPYPELQGKIRVYTVKSSVPNAFTTNNGIIFVNLGLLARLENEAQLAFILGHEVTHFQKKHVINKYVTNIDIEKGKGDYRKLSGNDKDFAKSSFSKELESEADLGGADIFLKSSYDKDSVYKVFDILKLSDLPLYWTRFDKKIFDAGKYLIPDSIPAKVKGLPSILQDDYDDSKRSHPNIKKRKSAALEKFKNGGKGDLYKISKSWFDKTKKIARYELCRTYLLDHMFFEALALAMSLQQENPSSAYLKETIAKAMYGLAKDRLNSRTVVDRSNWKVDAESAHLYLFIDKQSTYETSVMALRQLYACHEEFPENPEIGYMVDDLIRSFARKEKDLSKKFLRQSSDPEIAKLKHPYTQYAFLAFKDNNAFFKNFDEQLDDVKKEEAAKGQRKKKQPKKKIERVEKVVVVNPMYKKMDVRKRQKVRHIESEEVLEEINEKIKRAAGKLDMKADIINMNTLTSSQISSIQNNSILNDWIDEQMRSDSEMVSPIYNEVSELATQYKTDHFVWMGGITVTRRSRGKVMLVLGSIAFPGLIPLFGTMIATPKGSTLYFALVFNVRTQAVELVDLRQMNMKDTDLLMESNIYYSLFKLKKSSL